MVPQISCTGCRDSSLKEARRITAQAGHILALFIHTYIHTYMVILLYDDNDDDDENYDNDDNDDNEDNDDNDDNEDNDGDGNINDNDDNDGDYDKILSSSRTQFC